LVSGSEGRLTVDFSKILFSNCQMNDGISGIKGQDQLEKLPLFNKKTVKA